MYSESGVAGTVLARHLLETGECNVLEAGPAFETGGFNPDGAHASATYRMSQSDAEGAGDRDWRQNRKRKRLKITGLALLLALPHRAAAGSAGGYIDNMAPMRERVQQMEAFWKQKKAEVLPVVMREQGVDCWIVRNDACESARTIR